MSPVKAGEGFVDVFAKVNSGQLETELKSKLDTAGKLAGTSFQNAFTGKLKAAGSLIKANPEIFGAAVFVGAAVGIEKAADATADYAGEIRTFRATAGGTAEDASKLVAVFHDLGFESNVASRPLLTLADSIAKGGGKLKDFFSTADIARFRNQDLSKTLVDIGDKYKSLEDPIARDELVVAALGKRGLALRPIFAASREEIARMSKDAERSGLIFSDKQLDDARRYQIAVRELKDTFKGLEIQAGKVAIPALANAAENIKDIVLETEDAAHTAGDLFSHLPEPLKKVAGFAERFTLDITTFGLAELFRGGKKEGDKFDDTLQNIEASASDDEKAAKKLETAIKLAFDIGDKAAQDFDKRLDALIPKLGETYKDVKIGDVDLSAQGRTDASEKLTAAQNKLADAEDRLDKVRERKKHTAADVAAAERDVAAARQQVTAATDGAQRANARLSDALGATIKADADKTSRFADDLVRLNARFAKIATRGGEGIEQSFLAHLQDLGPGAAPLLDDLLSRSDSKLGELAGVFGDQVTSAKKAADLQFDKYPANFAEKIGAAKDAAVKQLQDLVGQFQALPDGADPGGAWASKMDDMARAIGVMDEQGKIHLSSVEQGFLDTALTAGDAGEKAAALQNLIDSLHGKSVDVNVNVNELFKAAPTDPTGALIGGLIEHRASGGPVRAGRSYAVGERGIEVFRPETSGHIVPNDALGGSTTVVLELDGEVLARKTVTHRSRADERYRRDRS